LIRLGFLVPGKQGLKARFLLAHRSRLRARVIWNLQVKNPLAKSFLPRALQALAEERLDVQSLGWRLLA